MSGNDGNKIPQLSVQNYLPNAGPERKLEPDEEKKVHQGLSQWFPAIFSSYATPLASLLANPAKFAVVSGSLGALATGIASMLFTTERRRVFSLPLVFVGGAVTAVISYFVQRQTNENVLYFMKRLPEGATKRDMDSDPAYQADLNRKSRETAACLSGCWCPYF